MGLAVGYQKFRAGRVAWRVGSLLEVSIKTIEHYVLVLDLLELAVILLICHYFIEAETLLHCCYIIDMNMEFIYFRELANLLFMEYAYIAGSPPMN